MNKAVAQVLRWYPRIYFACHTRHVRDPATGGVLSRHQASILSHLDAVDPTTVSELAQHMGVTVSTMSLSLKRLKRAGYVMHERSPMDGRVVQLRLTAAGVAVRDAQSVLDADRVTTMLAQLGTKDRQDALRGLQLLAEGADRMANQRADHRDATFQ